MSTTDVERLASWRTLGARRSIEVVDLGPRVLKAGGLGDQGEHLFVREQVAIAALDLGQIELAVEQLDILQKKFDASPRVALLHGLRLEARGDLARAKLVYETLLEQDECNVVSPHPYLRSNHD
jgi:hypothetical protein